MKTSDYNQYSVALQRKLKPTERAIYKVLNIREDPDNYGKMLMPAALQIPSTDSVYDKARQEFVNIAAIERTDIGGNAVFLDIVFSAANMGHIFLNGNNPIHQKIYQFLELCNYNQSNESRSEHVEPLFCRVDTQKAAVNERENRKIMAKAMNMAIDLDDKKAKEVAAAIGLDEETIEETRNRLEDFAGENPEEFMELVRRASLESESILKEAVKANIIRNNVQASLFEWTETSKEIYKYKKSPNKNYFKELAEYLEENNPDELIAIKTRLG